MTTQNTTLDRIKALDNVRYISPWETWKSSWREAAPEQPIELSTSYGDWSELKSTDDITPDTFVLIERTGYSDYSGSIVEASNHKAIEDVLQAAGLEDGTDYIDYYGGHGTRELAIRIGALQGPDDNGWIEGLLDTLEGLSDYPVADENLMSEMEMDSQHEAWDSWARSDFERELSRYLAAYIRKHSDNGKFGDLSATEELAEYAEDGDWITADKASDWFYRMADFANEYWINEQGTDSYINVERVVQNGLGRTAESFQHWPGGLVSLRELADDISDALNRAYCSWFYGRLAQHAGCAIDPLER